MNDTTPISTLITIAAILWSIYVAVLIVTISKDDKR